MATTKTQKTNPHETQIEPLDRSTEETGTVTRGMPADPRYGQTSSLSGSPHQGSPMNPETPINTPRAYPKKSEIEKESKFGM
jgi:hypothetical protein